jgi:CRISPR-associated protein Csm3
MVFEVLQERRIFEGKIITLTPLHIGSGAPEFKGEAIPILKSVDGRPYIPGSSLKGKVRSELEKLAKKLALIEQGKCKPPDPEEMCGAKARSEEDLCIACRIFGAIAGKKGGYSRASKVIFRDAYSKEEIKTIERPGIAIDRETGTVHERALYTIELVPSGKSFDLEIVTENLTSQELGLFLAALKSVEDLGLGGSISRGLGKVKIQLDRMIVRTAEYYVGRADQQILEGDKLAKWVEEKTKL